MSVGLSRAKREAGSSSTGPKRTRRRLSSTHVLIALAAILAFVLNLLVLADREGTVLVTVADRDLLAGTALSPSDLKLVPVRHDFEALDSLVTETDIPDVQGWIVQRPVAEGSLIDKPALSAPEEATGLRTMSVPVAPEHAAGGMLVAGDRVDVVTVDDGVAGYVAVDLEVLAVADAPSGGLGGSTGYYVVVGVAADEALALAEALDSGSVEIVRATGSEKNTVGGSPGASP